MAAVQEARQARIVVLTGQVNIATAVAGCSSVRWTISPAPMRMILKLRCFARMGDKANPPENPMLRSCVEHIQRDDELATVMCRNRTPSQLMRRRTLQRILAARATLQK